MSGISTGVGLISGIDTRTLIQQLLAIDARPKQDIQIRVLGMQKQQAAYLDLNTSLLSLKTLAAAFDTNKVFRASKATSSDTAVLSATAGANAAAGTYQFRVHRLVSTQQQLSRGFVDRDATAIGASSFTFEVGGGALTTETKLADLNGGAGVQRGTIEITDKAGNRANIDLATAVTVQDVIDTINAASGVQVTASIDGDHLKLTDSTGGSGTLTVANGAGSTTAESLGIAGSTASGAPATTLTGSAVRYITENTALAMLNDGNGVMIRDGATSFTITDRAGHAVNVDLGLKQHTVPAPPGGTATTVTDQTRAVTLGDVIRIINESASSAGANVTASIDPSGKGLKITDSTAPGDITGNLIVANGLEGRTTASDLGIATDPAGVAASTISGRRLISSINSSLATNLRGGSGLTDGTLTVTDRAGNSKTITVSAASLQGSVSDLISEINTKLASTNGGTEPVINVTVGYNRAGNGLAATDTTAPGAVTGNLTIAGAAATQLGLAATNDTDGLVQGTSLQTKWLSLATKVSTLNAGRGIGTGSFRVTDSAGNTAVYDITDSMKTIDDVLKYINTRPISTTVHASLNANGDGIIFTDTAAGTLKMKIVDESGTVAKSLNLVGEAATVGGSINGSYEKTVTFSATDTLEQINNKINSAGTWVTSTIIRDGSGATPYRLNFQSRISGQIGRAIVDTGALDLGLSTLAKGDDSVVFFGSEDPARAVLLSSSTNSLDNAVQGVHIDLNSASDENVSLTVSKDNTAAEAAINAFVKGFNDVLDKIDKYSGYDADTNTRGVLLGDGTADRIKNQLLSMVQGTPLGVEGNYQRLFQVGVKIGEGTRLTFNADKFRAALADSPDNVEALFSASERTTSTRRQISPGVFVTEAGESFSKQGVAERIESLANSFTNATDGLLVRRGRALDDLRAAQQKSIDAIDQRLARKQAVLEKQFASMEQALAQLQSQQAALGRISSIG